jgi:tRNA (adenine37-N6)-methyltransferase
MKTWTVRPVGFVHSPFKHAHEVPRGLGAKHVEQGVLEILPEFEAALKDTEGFSHLYVLWIFDRSQECELVGTPPCDTHSHGVFATRSPRRPNPIGLTVVRLMRREGNLLHVQGVDMLEGSPILDIKPYLSSVPESELRRGWLAEAEARRDQDKRRQAEK